MVADVVVENASYSFDIPFSYRVPGRMEGQIRPGCRVLVPFGRSTAQAGSGAALAATRSPSSSSPSRCCWTKKPLLGEEQLWLLELLHQRTFAPTMKGCGRWCPAG